MHVFTNKIKTISRCIWKVSRNFLLRYTYSYAKTTISYCSVIFFCFSLKNMRWLGVISQRRRSQIHHCLRCRYLHQIMLQPNHDSGILCRSLKKLRKVMVKLCLSVRYAIISLHGKQDCRSRPSNSDPKKIFIRF